MEQQATNQVAALEQALRQSIGSNADVRIRPLRVAGRPGLLVFLSPVVDKARLDLHVMRPLLSANQVESVEDLLMALEVSDAAVLPSLSLSSIEQAVLEGDAICYLGGLGAVRASLRSPNTRSVDEPSTETSTRGPRDSFTESLQTNLGLIRMRVKDRNLRIETLQVGRRTKTACAILYVESVTDPALVEVVRSRIRAIDVDGAVDDSLVQDYLSDRLWSPFPQMRPIERPDWVSWEILQGKVAVLVDGSGTAILGPAAFVDFYRTAEDLKHGFWEALYIRGFLRVTGFLLALFLPALYVALTDMNSSLLPTQLALSIAGSREGVPFPAVLEVLFMEVSLELLREAAMRMPRILASSVGIVGGLVLGEAAVQAKLVSDIMVIVISLTALSQFVAPSQEMGTVFRILRFGLTICAALLGVYGLVLVSFMLLFHLASLHSLGVPYLSPLTILAQTKNSGAFLRGPVPTLLWRTPQNHAQDSVRAARYQQPYHDPNLEQLRGEKDDS